MICTGLVRQLAQRHKLLFVAVHAPYVRSVLHLFKDVPNVHPYVVEDEYKLMSLSAPTLAEGGLGFLRLGYHKSVWATDVSLAEGLSFAQVRA